MSEASFPPALELKGITKSFGAVVANDAVSLSIARGSVHGLVGENGAGKSTLMSIAFGFYQADRGEMFVHGTKMQCATPHDAIRAGIGMVHQHFMLVENFTVLENILLGHEGGAVLRRGFSRARAALSQLAQAYDLRVPLDARVDQLSVGQQQRVEILKALYRGADILILDEPTGALTPAEADHLFRIVVHLKAQGKTIVLVTHKLREIMAITDAVSVMRRGALVATKATAATSPEDLAELMVGRRVLLRVDKNPAKPGAPVLQVRDLDLVTRKGVHLLKAISFDVHAGEILGIAGVAGNGQTELLDVLAGLQPWSAGTVTYKNTPLAPKTATPHELRQRGLAHVPEDRHRRGMVLSFPAYENAVLGYEDDARWARGPVLQPHPMKRHTRDMMQAFDIRPPNPQLKSSLFSGGNQQKLVMARELDRGPDLLLVGQPTRGVDIGAIEFIHRRLVALRDAGKAVVLVSVELDEIRALADRILVFFAGQIIGACTPATPEQEIGLMMAGVPPSAPPRAAA